MSPLRIFRTSSGTVLAAVARPAAVAFLIFLPDHPGRYGISVLNGRPLEINYRRDAKLIERLWKPEVKITDLTGDNELVALWTASPR